VNSLFSFWLPRLHGSHQHRKFTDGPTEVLFLLFLVECAGIRHSVMKISALLVVEKCEKSLKAIFLRNDSESNCDCGCSLGLPSCGCGYSVKCSRQMSRVASEILIR
jgi:hypothetical protein